MGRNTRTPANTPAKPRIKGCWYFSEIFGSGWCKEWVDCPPKSYIIDLDCEDEYLRYGQLYLHEGTITKRNWISLRKEELPEGMKLVMIIAGVE